MPTNALIYYANRLMNMLLGVIVDPEVAVEGLILAAEEHWSEGDIHVEITLFLGSHSHRR